MGAEDVEQLQADFAALVAVIKEVQEREGNLAEAVQERGLVQTQVRFILALRALRLTENYAAVLQLFADLNSAFEPSTFAFVEVLGTHVATSRWLNVVETFTRMIRLELKPDLNCYNCLLRAYAEIRSAKRAEELLRTMKQKGVLPDVTSFEFAITACRRSQPELAGSILKAMIDAKVTPSAVCYRHVIKMMGFNSRWRESIELYNDMRSREIEVDEKTLNTFLRACALHPESAVSTEVFPLMEADSGIKLTQLHYDVAIRACERLGDWQGMVALASRMAARGISPHEITINSIVRGLAEMGQWEAALTVLNSQRESGVGEDVLAYGLNEIMQACILAEEWNQALRLHTELRHMRRNDGATELGAEVIDVRQLPVRLAGDVVRVVLGEVLDSLNPEDEALVPLDIIVLVDEAAVTFDGPKQPSLQRSVPVEGQAAEQIFAVASEVLGQEAKLQCARNPFPLVRIPSAAFKGVLLKQRVQEAVSDFAVAGEPSGSTPASARSM